MSAVNRKVFEYLLNKIRMILDKGVSCVTTNYLFMSSKVVKEPLKTRERKKDSKQFPKCAQRVDSLCE